MASLSSNPNLSEIGKFLTLKNTAMVLIVNSTPTATNGFSSPPTTLTAPILKPLKKPIKAVVEHGMDGCIFLTTTLDCG